MFEILPARSLLRLDPDLGQLLPDPRRRVAEEQVNVTVATITPGAWEPAQLCAPGRASNLGLLILDGVVVRETCLLESPSGELFGPGDILRTWRADAGPQPLRLAV